jgi:Integral membrane protein (PIN domain superfamily)
MLLWALRGLFLLILAGVAARISSDFSGMMGFAATGYGALIFFGGIMGLGVLAVLFDVLYRRKEIGSISAVYFGVLIGILLGHLLGLAVGPTLRMIELSYIPSDFRAAHSSMSLADAFSLVATCILCYICVSVILQTKDDFRFIIPYVEFSRQLKGVQPLILDTSVIIDGRIADIADTGLLDQNVLIPKFVLDELQLIADSSDKLRRNRGRRGLDVVDRLQKCRRISLNFHEGPPDDRREVDARLIELAKEVNGRLATNDLNLAKSAKIQSVATVSMHEVSNAAKPPVMHGEVLSIRLVREGEEPGQGIGYLDDGTMVVAEMGRNFVGQEVNLVVTSILQTNAGRMVFGRIDTRNPEPRAASQRR